MVYWFHVIGTFLMRFVPVGVAYRLAADRLAAGSDEHLNRFMVALDGALSVLRQIRFESLDKFGPHRHLAPLAPGTGHS